MSLIFCLTLFNLSHHLLPVPLKCFLDQSLLLQLLMFLFCHFLIFASHHHLSCHPLVDKKALVFTIPMVISDRTSSCEILKNFDSKVIIKQYSICLLLASFSPEGFLKFSYLSRIRLNLLRSPFSGWKLVIKLLSQAFCNCLSFQIEGTWSSKQLKRCPPRYIFTTSCAFCSLCHNYYT